MKITGIVCEYNPFHLGHHKQIQMIRDSDTECGIVCLMSGNYTQRGYPAIFDKAYRAQAAIECGADLVLELPITASLASAERFASEGVRILGGFCDALSFGAEDADLNALNSIALMLLSPEFSIKLKEELSFGVSFPAARQKALESMGANAELLNKPNNILAVEYCKAILSQNSKMKPEPITREGNYHDLSIDANNPSASALRHLIENGKHWQAYVPQQAATCFQNTNIHTLQAGEKGILYRLRTMTDAQYEALPYGSEGLWRKLMKNARQYGTLEEIITATKSKRYTRTRLDRMILCAYLGLTIDDLQSPAPYVRVLALNNKGREILLNARNTGLFPNVGQKMDQTYQNLESRCDDLYGLFSVDTAEPPGQTNDRRIYYKSLDSTFF